MRFRPYALLVVLIAIPLAVGACGDKSSAPTTEATSSTPTGETTTGASAPQPPPPTSTVEIAPPPAGSDGAKAVAAYKAYLTKQARILVEETTTFSTALRRGDPETAVKTYPRTRAAYERLQRVAARMGLDVEMGAQEGTVPPAEWTGFHRIEKTIFDTGTTGGTEKPGARLLADAKAIRETVKTLRLDPALILADASDLANRIIDTTSARSEEAYSRANLYAVSGNIRSSEAAYRALRPLIASSDPKLAKELDSAYQTATQTVESFRTSSGLRTYDELGPQDVAAVVESVRVVAVKLAGVQL